MKFRITFFVVSLSFLAFSRAHAQESYHIRIKKHVVIENLRTKVSPSTTDSHIDLWMANQRMMLIDGDNQYVVDGVQNRMLIINARHQTFIEFPLPLNLVNHLDAYALLQHQTYMMRFYVYGKTNGMLKLLETEKTVLGKTCRGYQIQLEDRDEIHGFRSESIVWCTVDVPFDLESYHTTQSHLNRFLHYDYEDQLNARVEEIQGFPLLMEQVRFAGRKKITTTKQVTAISRAPVPENFCAIPKGFFRKEKISHDALVRGVIGPKKRKLEKEENNIMSTLLKFQKGFIERDTSKVETWVDALFADDVFIVGTAATFPGSGEWRDGRDVAIQLFGNDWRYWGNVTMYLDEAKIQVEGNAAWANFFATVTRKPGMEPRYRDGERIRNTMLNIIKDKADRDWSAKRRLYEIICDASWALVEYERSPEFIWPIRISLGLIKSRGVWKFKQVHFSHPSEGYPIVRLIRYKDN